VCGWCVRILPLMVGQGIWRLIEHGGFWSSLSVEDMKPYFSSERSSIVETSVSAVDVIATFDLVNLLLSLFDRCKYNRPDF
jgi:hypothetical protein